MAKKKKMSVRKEIAEVFLYPCFCLWSWMEPVLSSCESEWYEAFADIWGWDGNTANPKTGIRKLRDYAKAQSRKPLDKQHPFDPDLQFLVGVAYLCGWIPCEDPVAEAENWFRRAAEQDSTRAIMALGYLHEERLVKYPDEIIMLNKYTRAASGGNAVAQYRLAKYLSQQPNGDPGTIREYLVKSAEQQYASAKQLLAELYPETVHDPKYRDMYGDDWAKIAREHLESGKGLYAPKQETQKAGEAKLDKLIDLAEKGLVVVEDTNKTVKENNEIIKRMEVTLQMLQTSLSGMWKELREVGADHAEKLAELQMMVQQNLMKTTSSEIKDAETFMSILFGGDWRNPARLCDESCDALVSAHVLMAAADRLGIKNYAGIIITAVWALEHECRRRFRDAFDRYLAAIPVKKTDRPSRMNLNVAKDGGAEFTLGSVYFVVNPNKLRYADATVRPSEFNAFANATGLLSDAAKQEKENRKYTDAGMIFWDYDLPGSEQSFTDIIFALNKDYRIPAAHAQKMSKAKAEVCYSLLGITEENKRKAEQADNDLAQIEGALKALLWLTAPLK